MRPLFWTLIGVPMAAIGDAGADDYPTKPIRMVVASSPGTASDFLARLLAQSLSEIHKQQIVVDNRAGAGGLIGNAVVSKATPDGYTIGMIGATRIVSALLRKDAPYRPIEDMAPIAQVASLANAIVVTPSIGAKSVQELIALARAKPGQLNFASVGPGSSSHLAAEIFNRAAGIQVVHVPFKGVADVFTEMLAARVHYYVFTVPSTLAIVREGKLRALAVTTAKRSPPLPDVPTVAEAGLPAAQFDNWSGVIAPPGTPKTIVARLHANIVRILRDPETRERLARQGTEPTVDTTPASFLELMKAEHARYAPLIREAGLKPQ